MNTLNKFSVAKPCLKETGCHCWLIEAGNWSQHSRHAYFLYNQKTDTGQGCILLLFDCCLNDVDQLCLTVLFRYDCTTWISAAQICSIIQTSASLLYPCEAPLLFVVQERQISLNNVTSYSLLNWLIMVALILTK